MLLLTAISRFSTGAFVLCDYLVVWRRSQNLAAGTLATRSRKDVACASAAAASRPVVTFPAQPLPHPSCGRTQACLGVKGAALFRFMQTFFMNDMGNLHHKGIHFSLHWSRINSIHDHSIGGNRSTIVPAIVPQSVPATLGMQSSESRQTPSTNRFRRRIVRVFISCLMRM